MDHTRHCLVLRDTSIWLLVLGYSTAAVSTSRAIVIVVACILSILHWNRYEHDGSRKQRDMLAAQAYAVLDVLFGEAPVMMKVGLYALALLSYLRACACNVGSECGLIHHVFFRYCVFTVGFGARASLSTHALMSLIYVCHCCLLAFVPVPMWYLPVRPRLAVSCDGQVLAFLTK